MTIGTDPSPPRSIRLLTALLLVGTFALGSVTGAGLTLWLRSDGPRHGLHHGPGGGPLPLDELGLSPEQRQRADAVFERHRPELDAILQEGFPKVRRVNEQIESEIREILTPEQRKQLDELKARRPPPHHGHGGPGGPFGHPPPEGFGRPPAPPPGEPGAPAQPTVAPAPPVPAAAPKTE